MSKEKNSQFSRKMGNRPKQNTSTGMAKIEDPECWEAGKQMSSL